MAFLHWRGPRPRAGSASWRRSTSPVKRPVTEFWSQQVLASGNGNLFKVAKGIGSTNWHSHDDQDEVFLVIEGHITIQLRDHNVDLGPGDLFVIPHGTEHCPIAHEEARFLLVGPEVTSTLRAANPTGATPAPCHDRLARGYAHPGAGQQRINGHS